MHSIRRCNLKRRYIEFLKEVEKFPDIKTQFKSTFFELLDDLAGEMKERFSDDLKPLLFIYDLFFDTQAQIDNKMIKKNLNIYKDIVNFDILFSEIKVWRTFRNSNDVDFELKSNCVENLKELFIKKNLNSLLPNLTILFQIYLTVPISSSSSERSFSCLKRIKTWLRNSMSQDRLSSLAILSIEKEELEKVDMFKVLDIFVAKKERRISFN